MVTTSSLGSQHLSQRNASANAETKIWEIAGPRKCWTRKETTSNSEQEQGTETGGEGGGGNVVAMKTIDWREGLQFETFFQRSSSLAVRKNACMHT